MVTKIRNLLKSLFNWMEASNAEALSEIKETEELFVEWEVTPVKKKLAKKSKAKTKAKPKAKKKQSRSM